MPLEIVELNPKLHDRKGFDCGNDARNRYLRDLARQHHRIGFSRTFVLVESAEPTEILGFYSLSAAQVDLGELSEEDRRRLPRVPVPAARVGQLAVSIHHQGQGFGALLLQNAIKRALATRDEQMGVYLVLVDADSENAARFYRHFGFRECISDGRTLYLSLGKG